MRRRLRRLVPAVAMAMVLAIAPAPATSGTPPAASAASEKWHTRVFAMVGEPGYPAYVLAHRNGRVYAGSYVDPNGAGAPSKVFEWDRSGNLLRSWTVPGQRLDASHGVQVANQTRAGKLVVLETSTSSVLTLNLGTGRFRRVATLPGAVPNYASWGPRGAIYVTDYGQGVIWRVRRGDPPQRWFTSPQLQGNGSFGTTGIVYRPRRQEFLITQQTAAESRSTPTQGHLYRLPVRRGRPGTLTTLWTSQPGELPDGFGIGRSGHVYVALAGLTQQLVELTAGGIEVDRFPDQPLTGANGSPVPFDTPCNATFLGTEVLVANQSAVAGDPDHQAILAVEVGERGRRPYVPRSARLR